ncbi:stalk domain-containing protein [Pelotomaculum propionicicum]|uniref:stalk domain-containing protein n=1 Tax=Pelotomaculum propionicicum TaxID=258475 RepID=UPI003B75F674
MKKAVLIVTLSLLLITAMGFSVCSAAISPGLITPLPPVQIIDPPIKTIILAPSDLAATPDATSVELKWKDNSTNESGFEVERKSADGSFEKIATIGAGTTTYTDSGLAPDQYTYRVRAVTSSASSQYSNEATAALLSSDVLIRPLPLQPTLPSLLKPAAPGRLSAVALSGSEISLSWVDSSVNESGFKLERKMGKGDYAEIAIVPKDTTTYKDTGLQDNTVYSYRARAFNNNGASLYCEEVTVETPTIIYSQPVEGLDKVIKYRIGQNSYTVNGVVHIMDVAPVIINDRTYLPIRYVAEPLGATITWDASLQKVTFIFNGTTVEMIVNSNMAMVNGVDTPIAADPAITPLLISDRVQVPVAFVANSLGCDVAWDVALQEITVTYPKQ